jgi:DNA uptake protein ComE-like DNA-binding protein
MKTLLVVMALLLAPLAQAKETLPEGGAPTGDAVRVLGRLNVNTATRAQLLVVPGLSAAAADAILRERARAPITDVAKVTALPVDALVRLKTEGASDLRRIRQLPLVVLEDSSSASLK